MDDDLQQEGDSVFGDDLIPSWVPFNIAGVLLGISIILHILYKNHETKDRKSFVEFLLIVFLNMLILGGVQQNFETTSLAIIVPSSIYFLGFLMEMMILLGPSLGTIMDTIIKKRPAPIDNLSNYKKSPLFEDLTDAFTEDLNIDRNEFVATEKLEDLSSEFFRNILIGGAQVSLLAAYMAGVYIRGSPDFGNPLTYLYYYIGVFVQTSYVVAKGMINRSMGSILFWCKVSLATNDGEVLQDEKGKQIILKDMRASLIIRMFVSATVNGWGLFWTILLLPLQLASSESFTDFVLNAIAVFFIVELDDLEPCKTFRYAYSYLPITKDPTLRIRTSVQIMDKDCPDPGDRFVPTKDASHLLTFATGAPALRLQNVSVLRKNALCNFIAVKDTTCVRLPLQLLGPSSDLKNKDSRRRFDPTETAAFLMKIDNTNADPNFSLYKMNVENSKGFLKRIKCKIRDALEVLPAKPYEPVTEGQNIRLKVELMAQGDIAECDVFEPTKGVALFMDTETNEFSLLQREDQIQ